MPARRLNWSEIEKLIDGWDGDASDLALALRDFILEAAPEVTESAAFHSFCYHVPGRPYGVIGGHVCGIGVRGDHVELGFIHGASLPDPDGLLQGTGKAKRHIVIRDRKDFRRRAVKRLIRAAVAYDPAKE